MGITLFPHYHGQDPGNGEPPPPPPPGPGSLDETFETGWFVSGTYGVLATENFEAGWYTGNPFVPRFAETFESVGW